jgi:hypothetical protein
MGRRSFSDSDSEADENVRGLFRASCGTGFQGMTSGVGAKDTVGNPNGWMTLSTLVASSAGDGIAASAVAMW